MHLMLTDKNSRPGPTQVRVGHALFGGPDVIAVAGPCSVESLEQMRIVGQRLKDLGIPCIRGGAFKPRTSPYAFQGLGLEGLEILAEIRRAFDLAVITEIVGLEQVEPAYDYLDCYQVGARNMQNFPLLKALGGQDKPVLLKRGLAATLEEFLGAAEYLLAAGNPNVILCERGIRSFDPQTRNVLDLVAVARLKELTHLPLIVDPSHATGRRSLVLPSAAAAVAIGADGVIVEAHPQPEASVSDADQAISLDDLTAMIRQLDAVAIATGRRLAALTGG